MQAKDTLIEALKTICNELALEYPAKATLEIPKQTRFGDLSTNIAMLLASQTGRNARELGAFIANRLMENCPEIEKAEVAGPGFCNITFGPSFWQKIILDVEKKGAAFGHSESGQKKTALVEYVSANPTGPLHVGHGRGAALGDSIARILRTQGYGVETEYYLNDAGRQMNILGNSIWLRARELSGEKIDFPEDHYRGEYIRDLARGLLQHEPDLPKFSEKEALQVCRAYGMEQILGDIKSDLRVFRCEHNKFASEQALARSGAVAKTLEYLENTGRSYSSEGALWLKTADQGDDHDRVLRKQDGSLTYFATDIAYHHEKYKREYDWLIDVWGADHHGYVPRMMAAIHAMGDDVNRFSVLLVQLVSLIKDGKPVQMSTRSGEFYPLSKLIDEVGVDAARFTFLSRSNDSPLDFDVDLAKKRSMDNPVYYIQYAHARICALLRKATELTIALPESLSQAQLEGLTSDEEIALLRTLSDFGDTVKEACERLAPYFISRYLQSLAGLVHGYYAKKQIIDEKEKLESIGRLGLLRACRQVLRNGLFLLGVSAPEVM